MTTFRQAMKRVFRLPLTPSQSGDGSKIGDNKKTLKGLKRMNTITVILTLIPLVLDLMKAVEADMGSGNGPDKKAQVLSGVAAVVGDTTVWGKVQSITSGLIDVMAKLHLGAKA